MSIFALLARCALASVLAVAGASKLFSVGETARAAREFGFARWTAAPIGVMLPLFELGVALALVGSTSAAAGAIAAGVLLASFVVVTAVTVVRGRAVSCHCFGSLSSAAVSGRTVARNAGLFAAAAVTAAATLVEGSPLGIRYDRLDASQWVIAGMAGVVALFAVTFTRVVLMLLEQQGRLLLRIDELARAGGVPPVVEPALHAHTGPVAGDPAPDFALQGLHGETLTLISLRALGRPTLLVFSDPNCGPCSQLMPEVSGWQRDDASTLTTVVIASGSVDDNAAKADEFGLTTVLLDPDRSVSAAYSSPGTPSAVLIGADGRVMADLAAGGPNVKALVQRVLGATASAFALPDLQGRVVTPDVFARRDSTVVLFWNPACGFCQRMEARLQAWDHQAAGNGRGLLVISTGDPAAHLSLQLTAPVLLDDGRVMREFGANGTPMAVLVDAEGMVSSAIAAGEQAVFDLLGPPHPTHRTTLPVLVGGPS